MSLSGLTNEQLHLFIGNLTNVAVMGAEGSDVRGEKGTMSDQDGGRLAIGMLLPFLAESRRRGFNNPLDHLLDQ